LESENNEIDIEILQGEKALPHAHFRLLNFGIVISSLLWQKVPGSFPPGGRLGKGVKIPGEVGKHNKEKARGRV
jgi:hypothetical protein